MQVCTITGMKVVAVGDTGDDDVPLLPAEPCSFCATHPLPIMLPPALVPVFVLKPVRNLFPPLHFHSPRMLFVWSMASPRGPPLVHL